MAWTREEMAQRAAQVLQDSTFDLIDAGKMSFASGSSITLSERRNSDVFGNLERYKDKLVLRPQEISNHPEVVRRLGIIGINTALEFDIYGNVNSTHVCGTRMMNGIGGSGDFARNAHLAIFVTKSIAKGGAISSVVPMAHNARGEADLRSREAQWKRRRPSGKSRYQVGAWMFLVAGFENPFADA